MAEYSCPFTLVTPGPDITFNNGSGDEYFLDPQSCSGLDMPALRVTADDAPRTTGAVLFDILKGPMHVTLGGWLINRTGTATARNTMENNLKSALEAILAADGTLQQTPDGAALRSLTVRCEIPLAVSGTWQKMFVFGLIAATPTWA